MNLTASPTFNIRLLLTKYLQRVRYSRYATKRSDEIRQDFLNFFINKHDHVYVRSSPVIPFCDPTVAFVNAGMNQFKGVFLGQFSPPAPRVVNSQKCIRVGGNHNDLELVGTDGHHHTFFEMLGNWSFGDYYKTEACQTALELLTGPYGFNKTDLIISYFGGDKNLGLESDLECRDIWMNIGIPKEQLIPKGTKDNFWEMGLTGPCGPCTEIHFRDPNGNLTEIWNIVFIQFDRKSNGDINSLPRCHVDTGMGLERLTAILQNKKSNYDTDLFTPIIDAIHKKSGKVPKFTAQFGNEAHLDNAYRILADHARMVSVSLADGAYPCRNLRLRNVLRKALSMSRDVFQCPSDMMVTLYDQVAHILGPTYPELYNKANHCKQIIAHEEQSLLRLENIIKKDRQMLLEKYPETKRLPNELMPGLAEGYKQFKMDMKDVNGQVIPGKIAFKMYDAHGIDEKMMRSIAAINGLTVDECSFRELLTEHKSKHKSIITKAANLKINRTLNDRVNTLIDNGLLSTEDKYKYEYTVTAKNAYVFPILSAKVLAIITEDGELVQSAHDGTCHLIFDRSNFYCEEGGQCRDTGNVSINSSPVFEVKSVVKIRDIIVHTGKFNNENKSITVGDAVKLSLHDENRLSIMQHHTAVHLLNAAFKKVLPQSVTCQLSSRVTSSGLLFDLAVYGEKLSVHTVNKAQNLVRTAIEAKIPIRTSIINGQKLLNIDEVTMVPGEVYPEVGLRMVEIDLPNDLGISRELCCGTHVVRTDHLQDFCITNVRGANGHSPIVRAITGKLALQVGNIKSNAEALYKELELNEISDHEDMNERLNKIREELNNICKGDGSAYGAQLECLNILTTIEKKFKERNAKVLVELVQEEMSTVISEADSLLKNFIVHFLVCSYLLEPSSLSLTIAAQCEINKPILLMGCANGIIKATCQVPEKYVTENFSAEKWMSSIISVFDTQIMTPTKRQNPNLLVHMKGKKVSLINCESLVASAIKEANKYADIHFIDQLSNTKADKQSN